MRLKVFVMLVVTCFLMASPCSAALLEGKIEFNETAPPPAAAPPPAVSFIRCSADAKLDIKGQIITLEAGEVLVRTALPCLVKSGGSRILVSGNSICLINNHDDVVQVKNLVEDKLRSAAVFVGEKKFDLAAGQEFVSAPTYEVLGNTLVKDQIGRRAIRAFDLEDGQSAMLCDFSIASAAKKSAVVSPLIKSKDKNDKSVLAETMKMAAALWMVTGQRGQYLPIAETR